MQKILISRKGYSPIFIWIINLIVVFSVFFILKAAYFGVLYGQMETGNHELQILAKRIIYNPHCFAYENPDINRTEIGILDYSKINEKSLEECFVGENKIGVRVQIEDKAYYYDKEYYEDIEPLSSFQDYLGYTSSFFLGIKKGGELEFKKVMITAVSQK